MCKFVGLFTLVSGVLWLSGDTSAGEPLPWSPPTSSGWDCSTVTYQKSYQTVRVGCFGRTRTICTLTPVVHPSASCCESVLPLYGLNHPMPGMTPFYPSNDLGLLQLNPQAIPDPIVALVPDPVVTPVPTPTMPPVVNDFHFKANHRLTIKEIPKGAKQVDVWFWLPQETWDQKVLDLKITKAPGDWKIVTDKAGNRYLVARIKNPTEDTLEFATEFELQRRETKLDLYNSKAKISFTADQRKAYEDSLDTSVKSGFGITQTVEKKCNDVLLLPRGEDVIGTMKTGFDWVVDKTMHYNNPKNMDKSVQSSTGMPDKMKEGTEGTAEYCLPNRGGGCTDQHSLMIGFARLRDIPARMVFGQRLPGKENEEGKGGRDNPPYRCFVEYFVPGYGWVPMDASQAGNSPDKKEFYFSGMDAKRVTFYRGRKIDLIKFDGGSVTPSALFIQGFVLVDHNEHNKFEAGLKYVEVKK